MKHSTMIKRAGVNLCILGIAMGTGFGIISIVERSVAGGVISLATLIYFVLRFRYWNKQNE